MKRAEIDLNIWSQGERESSRPRERDLRSGETRDSSCLVLGSSSILELEEPRVDRIFLMYYRVPKPHSFGSAILGRGGGNGKRRRRLDNGAP